MTSRNFTPLPPMTVTSFMDDPSDDILKSKMTLCLRRQILRNYNIVVDRIPLVTRKKCFWELLYYSLT